MSIIRRSFAKANRGLRSIRRRLLGVSGNIDFADVNHISGWISKPGHAGPLSVDIRIDGRLECEALLADQFRQDVAMAGVNDGRCGFGVDLASPVNVGSKVSVYQNGGFIPVLSATISNPSRLPRADGEGRYEIRIEEAASDGISGWAISRDNPAEVVDLRIEINGLYYASAKNNGSRQDLRAKGFSAGLGGFQLGLPLDWLDLAENTVSIISPDGEKQTVLLRAPCKKDAESLHRHYVKGNVRSSDLCIIVPIYNAADDVRVCIDRLDRFAPKDVQIILINDASPDPEIPRILAECDDAKYNIVHNADNLGFTATVNKGMALAGRKDVVLLNSDARVTPGWIEGILAAANSDRNIATVTPMSDRAGAFSAPLKGNENDLPDGVSEICYAQEFRRHGLGLYPDVPTGNGFCIFIRRHCLDEIGVFDTKAFPRGYGEENDFCMRALRAGWRHVIDDKTYIFHDRSKSFGSSKNDLLEAGRRIVDERYPEYRRLIRCFDEDSFIRLARFRGQMALAAAFYARPDLPKVLTVISGLSGGTPQTNADMMSAIADEYDGWVLRCNSRKMELYHFADKKMMLEKEHALPDRINAANHKSQSYDAVLWSWLSDLKPEIVHIRHLVWHSLGLPEIASRAGAKVVFSFHDFYTLCPSLKLIDGDGNFCDGVCSHGANDCQPEVWQTHSFPFLRDAWVHVWRQKMQSALRFCDAFVTTSQSARDRLKQNLLVNDNRPFEVIEHGRDFDTFAQLAVPVTVSQPLKVLVPGNISHAKGLNIILDICQKDQGKTVEFHILGEADVIGRSIPEGLKLHGKYQREEFSARAEKIGANIGAIFSIWDETYCHTLTELWSAGFAAMVFDFGTVSERVRRHATGCVLSQTDPESVLAELRHLAQNPGKIAEMNAAVLQWQRQDAPKGSTAEMGRKYANLYRRISG